MKNQHSLLSRISKGLSVLLVVTTLLETATWGMNRAYAGVFTNKQEISELAEVRERALGLMDSLGWQTKVIESKEDYDVLHFELFPKKEESMDGQLTIRGEVNLKDGEILLNAFVKGTAPGEDAAEAKHIAGAQLKLPQGAIGSGSAVAFASANETQLKLFEATIRREMAKAFLDQSNQADETLKSARATKRNANIIIVVALATMAAAIGFMATAPIITRNNMNADGVFFIGMAVFACGIIVLAVGGEAQSEAPDPQIYQKQRDYWSNLSQRLQGLIAKDQGAPSTP